jgi:hypothetical protein
LVSLASFFRRLAEGSLAIFRFYKNSSNRIATWNFEVQGRLAAMTEWTWTILPRLSNSEQERRYTRSIPVRRLVPILLLAGIARAQPVTVPLIVEGNAPIVELEFSSARGVRKARFLVDTGGGDALMLGSKLMADVGATAIGPVSRGYCPLRPLPVKLSGMALDLTGVRILGTPKWHGPTVRNDCEGLIPGRLLRHYEVILDYPARRFTLANPGATEPRGLKVKTPIAANGNPRIELEIGGVTYGFLLDTGASFTMISRTVLDAWAKANRAWPAATGAAGFANMFGGKRETEALMLRIAEMGVGAISLRDVAAVSRPEGTFETWMKRVMTAPIIGSVAGNVLRDFRVEIDYRNGFTYLERSGFTGDADLVSVGLVLEAGADGNPLVSGISSAAADDVKAQVKASDKLLAVDGAPVRRKSLAAAAGMLQGSAGARKQLSLERGGKGITVSVTVARLL